MFAIAANIVSIAWFGDLLHALDARDRSDEATISAVILASHHYANDTLDRSDIENQTMTYLEKLGDSPGFEFLKAARVHVSIDPVARNVRVEINHQMPTRYLRFFGFSHWPVNSDISLDVKHRNRRDLGTV